MITSAKLKTVAKIGGMACEASSDNEFIELILAQMESLFGANGAIFYDMSGPTARPILGRSSHRKLDPYFAKIYSEYYSKFDPCFEALAVDPSNKYLSSTSTVRAILTNNTDEKSYIESEYYQDFLKPQDIHSSITFSLKNKNEFLGFFCFVRPQSRESFNDESHMLVKLISAPILQALELRRISQNTTNIKSSNTVKNFTLTPRQREISRLITLGFSNPEIARELQISAKTVENHLTQIYYQIGVRNRVMLAKKLSGYY